MRILAFKKCVSLCACSPQQRGGELQRAGVHPLVRERRPEPDAVDGRAAVLLLRGGVQQRGLHGRPLLVYQGHHCLRHHGHSGRHLHDILRM